MTTLELALHAVVVTVPEYPLAQETPVISQYYFQKHFINVLYVLNKSGVVADTSGHQLAEKGLLMLLVKMKHSCPAKIPPMNVLSTLIL